MDSLWSDLENLVGRECCLILSARTSWLVELGERKEGYLSGSYIGEIVRADGLKEGFFLFTPYLIGRLPHRSARFVGAAQDYDPVTARIGERYETIVEAMAIPDVKSPFRMGSP